MRVDKFSGRPVWRLAKIDQRDRIQSLQKEKNPVREWCEMVTDNQNTILWTVLTVGNMLQNQTI